MNFIVRIVIALSITAVIVIVSETVLNINLPRFAPALLYLTIYALLGRLNKKKPTADEQAAHPRIEHIPLPRHNQTHPSLFMAQYYLSALASTLNPFQLFQQMQQVFGQIGAERRYAKASYPSIDTFEPMVQYTLPFGGEWLVVNGGVTPSTSHSWDIITQRYAYDFVKLAEGLQRHEGNGRLLTDYACYDQPILAAAPGTIVIVRDGIRDWPHPGVGFIDLFCRDFRGNHVIIQHAENEFTVYAHLIPGSITAQVGDRVQRGQQIGRCGNSGHSTEPHLHFHLQDRADFFTSVGLPVSFSAIRVDGDLVKTPHWMRGGELVRQTAV